ncbi:hypothetical protein TUM3794_06030 [Shewanella colwelliana]|uniref:Big-1 domain-containing protein n=1 Tax=Shewanella colwelliana TaxID=23 RepID=A0ABQ4NVI2_SHECO|nr:Ig-like domain-containing protein [Shewanella colwelliana]GIU36640.1 hypothetical protein TUM3794_06030 [Shewanella colwelliana]
MRLIKNCLNFGLTLVFALTLSACNGAAEGTDTGGNQGDFALSLSYKTVENGQCSEPTNELSFATSSSICVVAHVTQGGSKSSGELVSFSATYGEIAPTTKLTQSNGLAEVILSNSAATIGAGIVTATLTPSTGEQDPLSSTKNYEFISDGATPGEAVPKLNASILKTGSVVTQLKVGETVQLQAQFVDNANLGIPQQIVTFTAGGATLTPNSALTKSSGIAQVSYTPSSTDLGAASLNTSITYKGVTYQSNSLYEVLPADAIGGDGTLKLGHFDASGSFVEGTLATTLTPTDGQYVISAGGSFGVTATIVNQADDGSITRVQTPTAVSFSSDCVSSNNASLDSPVTTLSGSATSTFQDLSCSGNSERDDIIVASVLAGNQTLSASLPFTLARQTLASLSFISAEPANIRIKGAGGTGSSESSLVTFRVTSANGQPTSQQTVKFDLDTVVGGLSFSNGQATAQSLTNSQGLASIRVLSGTVPTPVRVVASATDADTNETITSQSEQLTVNTGLPQQLGFSLSTSMANPEAGDHNGETVTITAYASDSFGNPAPDDTTINFTSEGGQIGSSCLTTNGSCAVTWTSASPRVSDHRITVLAYALGHETFFDTNGNNVFDDGVAVNACLLGATEIACSGNGMDRENYMPSGFSDLPDAFRDDNENFVHDQGEKFFNTKGETTYGARDTLFNGPQCEGSLCGKEQANKTYIRKALVMTMSGSTADFIISQNGNLILDTRQGISNPISALPAGASASFAITLFDSAKQVLPAGSNLNITASEGTLSYRPYTVPNLNSDGGTSTSFSVTNDIDPTSVGESSKTSSVSIELVTPKGIKTEVSINVELTGT